MKTLRILIAALCLSHIALAEMVVIVHPSNKDNIDKSTISNIFLGKTKSWPSGAKVVPVMVDYTTGDDLNEFLNKAFSRSAAQFRAYWAKMAFSGLSMPPQTYKTSQEVVDLVARNPDLIGVADAGVAKGKVKVVGD